MNTNTKNKIIRGLIAVVAISATIFLMSLTPESVSAENELAGTTKYISDVDDGKWVSSYATEDFSKWVETEYAKYGDDITLSEWISENNASSWITTSTLTNATSANRANRFLLEACLLYQYYESIGEANAINDENSIYLHEGMEQEAMARTIGTIIAGIQYYNSTSSDDYFDCILNARILTSCLRSVGITAYERYDVETSLSDSSENHWNVVAFPYGVDADTYCIMDTSTSSLKYEETKQKWDIKGDRSTMTCEVLRYNGLDTETLEIPETVTVTNSAGTSYTYTVVEVHSGVGSNAAYERSFGISDGTIGENDFCDYLLPTTTVIVPSTVTTLDANAFGNTTIKSVTTVVGMTGVTSMVASSFPSTVTTLNFLDNSTTGSSVNVIPARLATSWGTSLKLGCVKYEEGTTEIGSGKGISISAGVSEVYLPESLTTINSFAFYEATDLTEIYIPKAVSTIGEDAFDTSTLTTIYGISGSYAETYAEDNGIDFVAVTDVTTSNYSRTWTVLSYDIADATIDLSSGSSTAYTGSEIKPTVTVKLNGTTLTSGTDYTVSYTSNTNVGTATVKVTGCGDYTGSQSVTFTITAKSLSSATVTPSPSSYTYTGSECKPSVTVKVGSKTLTSGTDYTVSYSSNTNAGTATVTVTGKSNYTGSASNTFTISKASQTLTLSSTTLTVTKGSTGTISVTEHQGPLSFSTSNPSVATVNSSGVVTGVANGSAKITVTASSTSNYNSASATVTVTVSSLKSLEDTSLTTVTMSTVTYTPTADNLPDETITYNGTTLTRGTHYTRTFSGASEDVCNGAGTYTVTYTGIESAGYTGSVTKTYTVKQRSVTNEDLLSWSLSSYSYTYTGSDCKPTVSGLYTSSKTGKTAVPVLNTDYTVSYSNNVDAGTATVTITGKGNYKGTKTLTFTINKASQSLSLSASATSINPGSTSTITVNGAKTSVSYSSSSTGVATVSSNGVVTGKGYGTTTITITAAGNDNYNSASKTVSISVLLKTPSLSSVTNANGGVTVKWSAVSGAAKYRVFRRVSGGAWVQLGDTTSTSYTDKTAKSGTTYIYTVRCVNSAGTYTSSYESGKSIKYLAVPSLSSATNVNGGVTVKWASVSGATKYRVWRKVSGGSWVQLGDTTSTSYTDKTAKSGTAYYYTVRAINGSYMSYYNTSGKGVKYLATPSLSSVSNSSSGLVVSWGSVSGASKYRVFRRVSGGSWVSLGDVSSTSFTDKTAKAGTLYYYTVRAINGSYMSYYNTSGKANVRLTTPSLSSVKNSSSKKMTVKWSKVSSVNGYQIQYSTSSSFSGAKTVTASSASTTSKTLSSLTKGKTYYVRIRTYKTVSGTNYYSAWSSTKTVKISK